MGLSNLLARLIRDASNRSGDEMARAQMKLDEMKSHHRTFPAMLSLVVSTRQPMVIRQGAAHYLETWLARVIPDIPPFLPKFTICTSDMEKLKRAVIPAVVKTASCPTLQYKVLRCFEWIAYLEFRHPWPSIYEKITALLESPDDTKVVSGLQLFIGLIKAHEKFKPFENTLFNQQLYVMLELMRTIVTKRPTPTPLMTPSELQVTRLVLRIFILCLKHVPVHFLGDDDNGWSRFSYVVPIIEAILRESYNANIETSPAFPQWMELNEMGLSCVELVMCRHVDIDSSTLGQKFHVYWRDKLNNIVELTVQLLLKQYFKFTHSDAHNKPLLRALFVLLHSSKLEWTRELVESSKIQLFPRVLLPLLCYGPNSEHLLDRNPSEFITRWFRARDETSIPTCASHILNVLQTYDETDMNTLCGSCAFSILSPDVIPQQKFGLLYSAGILANSSANPAQNFIIPPENLLPLLTSLVEPDYVRLAACWVTGFLSKFRCEHNVCVTAATILSQLLAADSGQPDYIKGMAALSLEKLCSSEKKMPYFHCKMGKIVNKVVKDMIVFTNETNDEYTLLKNFIPFCEQYVNKLSVYIVVLISKSLVDLFMKQFELSLGESSKFLEKLVEFVSIVEKANHPGLLVAFDTSQAMMQHVVQNEMSCWYHLVCQLINAFGGSLEETHVTIVCPLLIKMMEQHCLSAVTVGQNLMFINPTFKSSVGHDVEKKLQQIVTNYMGTITRTTNDCPPIFKIALECLHTNLRSATLQAQISIVKFALETLEKFIGKIPVIDCLCAKIIFAPMLLSDSWEMCPELRPQLYHFINNLIYRLQPGRLFDDGITLIIGYCAVIKYRKRQVRVVPICFELLTHMKRLVQAIIHILEKLKEKNLANAAAMKGLPIQALPMFVRTMSELMLFDTPSVIRILNRLTVDEQVELRYVDVEEITRVLPFRIFY